MQTKKLILAPMWGGKTRMLADIKIQNPNWLAIENDYNTRNSERELSKLVPSYQWRPGTALPEAPGYIFDEVHLYQVFDQTKVFLSQIFPQIEEEKSIVAAGVAYDCYNNYELFPIYGPLFNVFDVQFLNIAGICAACGRYQNTPYTRATTAHADNCVGDGYENICTRCALESSNLFERKKS